ncbi:MAG TPA: acetamidase/formamidase family protein [Chitinophagaceae bacterium]|nr:acetamidase/formamidase family protein [Chitinophagaceae bacterium]
MKWYFFILGFVGTQTLNGQDTSGHNKFIHFTPTTFSNSFKLNISPVLSIHSDDTVSTETIDAAGFDKHNIKRQKGGNPLTGPFYIEDSKPGDVLAITLTRISLNRSSAITTGTLVSRALPKSTLEQFPKKLPLIKWNLDQENSTATLDSSFEHLQNFKIPLHPFLGCIGVAPDGEKSDVLSFFLGTYGGNLDFSAVAQGATVYLPVFHDGANLFIGDGHAVQGDGEIAGNALETSLDVEFTVHLIKNDSLKLTNPIIEDSNYMMSAGSAKSLDDAIKVATSGLFNWLRASYHLSLVETSLVLSTSIEYTIAEIADPEVEVVAKIKKKFLSGLKK